MASPLDESARADRRQRISVVLCDDSVELRSILHDVLAHDPSIAMVGETDNGRDCVATIRRLEPDVVVLDLSMPNMAGFEAIPLIVKHASRTAIIVFSGCAEKRLGELAIGLGAHRHVEKGAARYELTAAVVEVAESRNHFGGEKVDAPTGSRRSAALGAIDPRARTCSRCFAPACFGRWSGSEP